MLKLKDINDKFNVSCHVCRDNIIWSSKTSHETLKELMAFLANRKIPFKFDGINLRSKCSYIKGCWNEKEV